MVRDRAEMDILYLFSVVIITNLDKSCNNFPSILLWIGVLSYDRLPLVTCTCRPVEGQKTRFFLSDANHYYSQECSAFQYSHEFIASRRFFVTVLIFRMLVNSDSIPHVPLHWQGSTTRCKWLLQFCMHGQTGWWEFACGSRRVCCVNMSTSKFL